jgi:hypothetical protein
LGNNCKININKAKDIQILKNEKKYKNIKITEEDK